MSASTSNLLLPYLAPAQAQKHVTVNESLQRLDALVQLSVVSRSVSAQPASPNDGELYLLPAGKSGAAWAAMANHALAYYRDGAWEQIAPREGFLAWVKDEDAALAYDGAAWALIGSARHSWGFKNRLINGGFAINQRAASSSADDTYCLDRWYVLTQSGAVAASQLADPENGAPFALRLTQSQASAQRIGVAQIIESANCRDLRGALATLAGRVRRSDGGDVRCAVLEWTGAADAVVSDVVNDWTSASYSAGGFFNAANLNVLAVGETATSAAVWAKLTALSATFGASVNNIIIVVWSEGTMAQNATFDLNRMQFEAGGSPTPFEHRPFSVERSMCMRYFEKSFRDATEPAQNVGAVTGERFWLASIAGAGTQQGHDTRFQASKRVIPTMTLYNPAAANAQARDLSLAQDCSATQYFGVSENGFATNCIGHASTGVGHILGIHWTADAEL